MHGSLLLLLPAQVVLALAGLWILRRSVLPALIDASLRDVVADVWGPLALVTPMLAWALGIRTTMTGTGWLPVGGPACVGVFLAGSALLLGPRGGRRGLDADSASRRLFPALLGAGVVIVLLSAAAELTIWTGQIVFAIAAVFLWMSTPRPEGPRTVAPPGTRRRRRPGPGAGAAIVMACAVGQGVCALVVAERDAAGVSALLVFAYAAAGAMIVARSADQRAAVRIGGWTAVVGVLLGVGTVSLTHLAPQAAATVTGRHVDVQTRVARGFGQFALEGGLLLALGFALWIGMGSSGGLGGVGRRLLGAVLVGAAVVAAALDLAGFWPLTTPPVG